MSLVVLVSGGIDSAVMTVLAKEGGINPHPLFIDYGQRSVEKEWEACVSLMRQQGVRQPVRMNLSGYGQVVPSGLTRNELRVDEDAFLPGRNLLFILAGAAYACGVMANAVAIGLLDEAAHIFPDQTSAFLRVAEATIETALGRRVTVVAPLLGLSKAEVMALARERGISGTYSCHMGGNEPCGKCISCREIAMALGRED